MTTSQPNTAHRVRNILAASAALVAFTGFAVAAPATATAATAPAADTTTVSTPAPSFPEQETTNVVNNTAGTVYIDQVRGQFRTLQLAPGTSAALINDKTNPWYTTVAFNYSLTQTPAAASDTVGVQTFITTSPWSVRVWPNSRVTTTDQSKQVWVTNDKPGTWKNLALSYQGQPGVAGGVFTIVINPVVINPA